jgi:TRAP-type mannitol/chloroaromatic compound transport system substrate-binding protein
MFNLDKWNGLPKSYQAIVTAACEYTNIWMMGKYDWGNPAALRRLVTAGAKLQPFSQPIMEASLKAANEVYAETSAANADFKRVWDSIAQYRGDQYLWWQVAEFTYDSFMIRSRGKGWS